MKACPRCGYPEGLISCPMCHRWSMKRTKIDECPSKDKHTPHPTDYLWHEAWAREMLKTHTQKQCPDCGLWEIWEPKKVRGAKVEPTRS